MLTYFAKDGSYGDAEDILVIDTSKWSDEEREAIDMCADNARWSIAAQIEANYSNNPEQGRLELDTAS
jgi:hypothetical protein